MDILIKLVSGCRESSSSVAFAPPSEPGFLASVRSALFSHLRARIPFDSQQQNKKAPLALFCFCRAAGNRTRSTCTPCMRTTGILQPVLFPSDTWNTSVFAYSPISVPFLRTITVYIQFSACETKIPPGRGGISYFALLRVLRHFTQTIERFPWTRRLVHWRFAFFLE